MKKLTEQQIRLIALSVVFALFATGIIIVVLLFLSPSNDVEGETYNQPISDSDKTTISNLTENFVRVNSTWGVKENSVNADNYFQIALDEVGSVTDEETANYIPRISAYDRLRENYIIAGSPLSYGERNRSNILERSEYNLSGLANVDTTVNVSDYGYQLDFDGNMLDAVKVTVNFTNKYYVYEQTGNDVEWDGTVELAQQNYDDSGELVVVKDLDDIWKVYSFSGVRYPTILATGTDPNVPNDVNGSMEIVDSFKVDF